MRCVRRGRRLAPPPWMTVNPLVARLVGGGLGGGPAAALARAGRSGRWWPRRASQEADDPDRDQLADHAGHHHRDADHEARRRR